MSVNTAHANNGVLIHAGEYILLHCDNVTMDFSGQDNPLFKSTKQGRIYLTSHRMIFNNKKSDNPMLSFSAPFILMSDVELEQPVFGANYIKGKVRAQPNGNFVGEVKFKLHFKSGGAIEYGQALLRAAGTAQSNMRSGQFSDDPPPYSPSGAWHEAPPPAYVPPPGYYGWLPQHDAFTGPAPNSVYMTDNPPPYPGIGGPPPYAQPPQQQPLYPAANVYNQQQQQAVPSAVQNQDLPSWNGFSAPPPEPQPASAPGWNGGYQHPPPYGYGAPGYNVPPAVGFPSQTSAPGYGPGYPPGPQTSYPYPPGAVAAHTTVGAMGFSAPPPNTKEAEALASASNNTSYNRRGNHQSQPSDIPPAYDELPPNYYSTRKNQ